MKSNRAESASGKRRSWLGGVVVAAVMVASGLVLYRAFQRPSVNAPSSAEGDPHRMLPERVEGYPSHLVPEQPSSKRQSQIPHTPEGQVGKEESDLGTALSPAASPDLNTAKEASSPTTEKLMIDVRSALEEGEPEEALRLLDSALLENAEDEYLWLSKAGVYLQLGRYNLAWFALQKVRQPELRNPYYYYLEGEIHYYEERLYPAIESYRKSLQLEENEAVRRRLDKALREYRPQQSFRNVKSEHFTLSYADRSIEPMARSILDNLERLYAVLSREFGVVSTGPTVVILYPEVDFRRVTEAPDWAGGLYDQKIRVPVKGLTPGDPGLERVLKHELVHALVYAKCAGACPRWLNEGLAQYFEGVPLEVRIRSLRRTVPSWRVNLIAGFREGENPLLFYTRSLSITAYLIEKEGMHKVMELLSALAKGRDERQAIKETFHREHKQIFESWQSYAERQIPKR